MKRKRQRRQKRREKRITGDRQVLCSDKRRKKENRKMTGQGLNYKKERAVYEAKGD